MTTEEEYLERLTRKVLEEIHDDWSENEAFHKERYSISNGIRSSQMSALIKYLITQGVINA